MEWRTVATIASHCRGAASSFIEAGVIVVTRGLNLSCGAAGRYSGIPSQYRTMRVFPPLKVPSTRKALFTRYARALLVRIIPVRCVNKIVVRIKTNGLFPPAQVGCNPCELRYDTHHCITETLEIYHVIELFSFTPSFQKHPTGHDTPSHIKRTTHGTQMCSTVFRAFRLGYQSEHSAHLTGGNLAARSLYVFPQ